MIEFPTEKLNCCPNCQSENNLFWCQGHDRLYELSSQEFIYSQCQNCDLIYLSLRPLETEIYNFYPDNYQPYQSKKEQENSQNLNLLGDELVKEDQFFRIIPQKIVTKSWKFFESGLTTLFPEIFETACEKFYQPRLFQENNHHA